MLLPKGKVPPKEGCNLFGSETKDERYLIMVIIIITPISRKWKAVGKIHGGGCCLCEPLIEVLVF